MTVGKDPTHTDTAGVLLSLPVVYVCVCVLVDGNHINLLPRMISVSAVTLAGTLSACLHLGTGSGGERGGGRRKKKRKETQDQKDEGEEMGGDTKIESERKGRTGSSWRGENSEFAVEQRRRKEVA